MARRKIRKRTQEGIRPVDALGIFSSSERNMLFVEDNYPTLTALPSHALRLVDQAESEPTQVPIVDWNPRTRQLERTDVNTARKTVTRVDWEVDTPAYTHSKVIELGDAGVIADFILLFDAQNYADRKAEVYRPTTPLNQPRRTENLKMGGLDPQAELIGKITGGTSKGIGEIWAMRADLVNDLGANPLYAVSWAAPDYDGVATECPGAVIVGGGQLGGGTDEILSVLSSDNSRFDTSNELATGLTAGKFITNIIQVGQLTFATYADNINPSTATDGGLLVYDNGAVEEALLAGMSAGVPLYGLAYDTENRRIIATGKGGKIFTISRSAPLVMGDDSDAGVTDHMVAIAVSKGTGYIACSNGNAYAFTGVAVVDITTEVVSTIAPSALHTVAHLGDEHIAFGGASGFYSETLDGGGYWEATQLNNGAGELRAITGETWRVFVGIDDTVFERSVLSLQAGDQPDDFLKWREFALEGGASLSGNIRSLKMLKWMSGPNVFVGVTDTSEVFYGRAVVASC